MRKKSQKASKIKEFYEEKIWGQYFDVNILSNVDIFRLLKSLVKEKFLWQNYKLRKEEMYINMYLKLHQLME